MYRIYKQDKRGTYRIATRKQFASYEAARKTAVRLVRTIRKKKMGWSTDAFDGYPPIREHGFKVRKVA